MNQRRLTVNYTKLAAMVVIGTTIYSEWWVYFYSTMSWPSALVEETPEKLGGGDSGRWAGRVTLLFVADPQIQGFADEPAFPVGCVTRWDSDRYLRKTFRWALGQYEPDVVVFLGDLIDEGSRCDNDTYAAYATRFHDIYNYPQEKWKKHILGKVKQLKEPPLYIFVPGDNDIGGEGSDLITQEKVDRYERFFPPRNFYDIVDDRLQIVPTNRLKTIAEQNGTISVYSFPHEYPDEVLKKAKPSVIFSAHAHQGWEYQGERVTGREKESPVKKDGNDRNNRNFFTANTKRSINIASLADMKSITEIIVPTCSYRMGVPDMALGLARVELATGDIRYDNLWLPGRFGPLYLYAAAAMVAAALLLMGKANGVLMTATKPRSRRPSSNNMQYAKQI